MMGHQSPPQDPLFSVTFQLETRVRTDHPLRRVNDLVDFYFIYDEVADTYGENGNVSVPPPVILKLMSMISLGAILMQVAVASAVTYVILAYILGLFPPVSLARLLRF